MELYIQMKQKKKYAKYWLKWNSIFFFLGVSLAANSANQYVDNILQTSYPQEIKNLRLDPAPLPDFVVKFGYRDIYNNQGEAHFRNGNATGFTRLRRSSDCQGPRTINGLTSINCTLTLFPFVTNYNAYVRNGSNIYVVRNMGHIGETLIEVKIAGYGVGQLKSFEVVRMGNINPTYHRLPQPLLVYTKVISDEYRVRVSTNLFNMLRDRVKNALQKAMTNKPMPRS